MSTLHTITQLSIGRFSSTFPGLTSRRNRFAFGVKCALYPERKEEGRRLVSIALTSTILFHHWFFTPAHATAASVFDKYLKRKKLDPLEAYVPSVILTELQIKDLGNFLEVDQPKYADCRNLLRSGPAASLRVNIRAVAQYASDGGNGKNAFGNVDQCLRALEELDSLLLHASRNQPDASIKSMKSKIDNALTALDSLLETVPPDVLYKGRAIAEAYRTPEDLESENTDSELKQLESIL